MASAKVIQHNRRRRGRRPEELTRQDRQKRVGQAIREARQRAELTQDGLGELLAPLLGHDVPQTTISRWEIGSVAIDLEQLHAVEKALGLSLGTLFTNGGYCQAQHMPKDVENAIRSDRALDESLKDTVVSMYRSAVTLSRRINQAEKPARRRTA